MFHNPDAESKAFVNVFNTPDGKIVYNAFMQLLNDPSDLDHKKVDGVRAVLAKIHKEMSSAISRTHTIK